MKNINERIAELRQEHMTGRNVAETLRNEDYSLEEAQKALQSVGYIVELKDTGDFTTMHISGVPVKRGAAQYLNDHKNEPWPAVTWPKRIQQSAAMQRHHDYYVTLYRQSGGKLSKGDSAQYDLAMQRETDGEVNPLADEAKNSPT